MNGLPITEDDLHAYVDDALDAGRRAEVAAYLARHGDVAERVAADARDRDALRAAFAPIAEEPVPPELDLARMMAVRRRRSTGWWQAAAAAVLLCLGGAGGWSLRATVQPVPEGVAALVREAADSYDVYAPDRVHPVEIRADDRAELVAWASARLGRRVEVADLSASGFRFMGGRMVATAHGPAAMFMYDDDHGARLVLLTRAMAVDRDTPMAAHARGTLAGFTWSAAGMGYSLVGPVPPETLHPLADEVRKQLQGRA